MKIIVNKRKVSNEQFGKALELYYHKGYNGKYPVGKFLNHVFKLNDARLDKIPEYIEGLQYFKNKYVD